MTIADACKLAVIYRYTFVYDFPSLFSNQITTLCSLFYNSGYHRIIPEGTNFRGVTLEPPSVTELPAAFDEKSLERKSTLLLVIGYESEIVRKSVSNIPLTHFPSPDLPSMKFDLEERLIRFGVSVLDLSKKIRDTKASNHLCSQLDSRVLVHLREIISNTLL